MCLNCEVRCSLHVAVTLSSSQRNALIAIRWSFLMAIWLGLEVARTCKQHGEAMRTEVDAVCMRSACPPAFDRRTCCASTQCTTTNPNTASLKGLSLKGLCVPEASSQRRSFNTRSEGALLQSAGVLACAPAARARALPASCWPLCVRAVCICYHLQIHGLQLRSVDAACCALLCRPLCVLCSVCGVVGHQVEACHLLPSSVHKRHRVPVPGFVISPQRYPLSSCMPHTRAA